jgi:hypothetical protein
MGLTFPSDLFPSDVVASVTGLSGLAAGLAGTLVEHFSFLFFGVPGSGNRAAAG